MKPGKIDIRAMHERDIDSFMTLFDAGVAELRWFGVEPGYDREGRRAQFLAALDDAARCRFVALEGGAVVGACGLHLHAVYGYVLDIHVDARLRGRGIGRALLERALDWARERRIPEVSLLVFAHNEAAIALYRRAGFLERAYYERDVIRQTGEVFDSILMSITLA